MASFDFVEAEAAAVVVEAETGRVISAPSVGVEAFAQHGRVESRGIVFPGSDIFFAVIEAEADAGKVTFN